MNAALKSTTAKKVRPASIGQLAKLNQLVVDQEPTSKQLQEAMRFVPDLLNADLAKVNRFDLCRLLGRKLPFRVCTYEYEYASGYDKPVVSMLLGPVAIIQTPMGSRKEFEECALDMASKGGKPSHRFFIVRSRPNDFDAFDLVAAGPHELLGQQHMIKELADHIHHDYADLLGDHLHVWGKYMWKGIEDGCMALRYVPSKNKFDTFYIVSERSREYTERFRQNCSVEEHYFLVRRKD